MPEILTEEEFSRHLHTKYQVRLDGEHAVELELDEIAILPALSHARGDAVRFSLFFYGPGDFLLPQHIYRVGHEHMGEFDLFIVPIARDSRGYRYEAVFSYFK